MPSNRSRVNGYAALCPHLREQHRGLAGRLDEFATRPPSASPRSPWDSEKNDPAGIVRTALDGLEADEIEILADENTAQVRAALSAHPSLLYPQTVSAA
jgi:hypothetical protein